MSPAFRGTAGKIHLPGDCPFSLITATRCGNQSVRSQYRVDRVFPISRRNEWLQPSSQLTDIPPPHPQSQLGSLGRQGHDSVIGSFQDSSPSASDLAQSRISRQLSFERNSSIVRAMFLLRCTIRWQFAQRTAKSSAGSVIRVPSSSPSGTR